MLEVWAAIEVWIGFILPAAIIVIILGYFFCVYLIKNISWNRKIRWLQSNGFERYLIGVPSVGGGSFYGWRNKTTGKMIDDRELDHLKFNVFISKMKG